MWQEAIKEFEEKRELNSRSSPSRLHWKLIDLNGGSLCFSLVNRHAACRNEEEEVRVVEKVVVDGQTTAISANAIPNGPTDESERGSRLPSLLRQVHRFGSRGKEERVIRPRGRRSLYKTNEEENPVKLASKTRAEERLSERRQFIVASPLSFSFFWDS